MGNAILRLYGHIALFVGIIGTGFAILVIGLNPDKVVSWVVGFVCINLAIIGILTILNN